jgi:Flp pilus assembly protein TadG
VEVAILFPVALALVFGAVQAGLWFQARNLCHAAAQAGVRAATVAQAGAGTGSAAASSYLRDVAGAMVVAAGVSESRTAATVTVTCSGQAQLVLPSPWFSIEVTQSATGGIERFTTP